MRNRRKMPSKKAIKKYWEGFFTDPDMQLWSNFDSSTEYWEGDYCFACGWHGHGGTERAHIVPYQLFGMEQSDRDNWLKQDYEIAWEVDKLNLIIYFKEFPRWNPSPKLASRGRPFSIRDYIEDAGLDVNEPNDVSNLHLLCFSCHEKTELLDVTSYDAFLENPYSTILSTSSPSYFHEPRP